MRQILFQISISENLVFRTLRWRMFEWKRLDSRLGVAGMRPELIHALRGYRPSGLACLTVKDSRRVSQNISFRIAECIILPIYGWWIVTFGLGTICFIHTCIFIVPETKCVILAVGLQQVVVRYLP